MNFISRNYIKSFLYNCLFFQACLLKLLVDLFISLVFRGCKLRIGMFGVGGLLLSCCCCWSFCFYTFLSSVSCYITGMTMNFVRTWWYVSFSNCMRIDSGTAKFSLLLTITHTVRRKVVAWVYTESSSFVKLSVLDPTCRSLMAGVDFRLCSCRAS